MVYTLEGEIFDCKLGRGPGGGFSYVKIDFIGPHKFRHELILGSEQIIPICEELNFGFTLDFLPEYSPEKTKQLEERMKLGTDYQKFDLVFAAANSLFVLLRR